MFYKEFQPDRTINTMIKRDQPNIPRWSESKFVDFILSFPIFFVSSSFVSINVSCCSQKHTRTYVVHYYIFYCVLAMSGLQPYY